MKIVEDRLLPALFVALASGLVSCGPAPSDDAPAPAPETAQAPATRVVEAPHPDLHWTYEGNTGPSQWGVLSPEFSTCGEGTSQSPIDITGAESVTLSELNSEFGAAELMIVHHEHMADAINNGHTIQINYTDGATIETEGKVYELHQYHFHGPSEHTVDGEHFPMEMHLVHQAEDGAFAVIGVFIEEGAHNAAFDPIWSNLPGQQGVENHFEHITVDVDDLLPEGRTTYRYEGSLTTPPCSEEVQWFLGTEAIQLAADQIAAFTAIVEDNNRPVQPLNGRALLTDDIDEQP